MDNHRTEKIYLDLFENFNLPLILLTPDNTVFNYNHLASGIFPNISKGLNLSKSENPLHPLNAELEKFNLMDNTDMSLDLPLRVNGNQTLFTFQLKKLRDIKEDSAGTLLTIEDLSACKTENKKLEEAKTRAEESEKVKTSFLANMSHEIRTPMNAILGFTEIMLNGNHGEMERKEYLELIRRSSSDLLNIVEDIIDIAKLEAKQLKIRYKVCKPQSILKDLHAVFEEIIRRHEIQKSVKLVLDLPIAEKDMVLFTDGERLKQLISNLLTNAVKFTSKGFIEFGYKKTSDSHLIFFVRDTGTGIPEEMHEKIFDRFVQLEEHLDRNKGGAGLGLSICKNIVDLLGGRIWLESEYGKGSDFYFQIPIHDAPKEMIPHEEKSGESNTLEFPDWQSKHILVAEDDEMNFLYISELLKPTKVNLIHAKNGLEAINYAESADNIDLILMDIKMPQIDGLEATKYIVKILPSLPVIALTAYALHGDKVNCLNAGCAGYLTKPVIKEQLFTILEKYFTPANSKHGTNSAVEVR